MDIRKQMQYLQIEVIKCRNCNGKNEIPFTDMNCYKFYLFFSAEIYFCHQIIEERG